MVSHFKIIDTTADIKIIAFGNSLEAMFGEAGKGLFSVITDLDQIKKKSSLKIKLKTDNMEQLLIMWLNELLYKFSTNYFLGKEFIVTLNTNNPKELYLNATIWGEKYKKSVHKIKTEIKAVTYHQLKIIKKTKGYQCEVILDV